MRACIAITRCWKLQKTRDTSQQDAVWSDGGVHAITHQLHSRANDTRHAASVSNTTAASALLLCC